MTLRVALVIDGNAAGAKKAVDDTARGLNALGRETANAANENKKFVDGQNNAGNAAGRANTSLGSLRGTFKALAREAALLGGPLAGVIGQASALTIGTGRLGVGISATVLGIAAVTAATYKSVSAFSELESHQAKIANALAVTRGASGQTVDSLEALTRQLSANGTQTVEDLRIAEGALLRFKAVGGETFGEVLRAAKDVAATGFADLKSATEGLAKALSDPANAAEHLKEVGLSLSAQQQRLAADLYATGQRAQAQRVILDAVSKQVAGSDARAADTLGAAWGRLSASGGLLVEQWGRQIASGLRLKDVINGIASAADRASKPRDFAAETEQAIERAQNPSRNLRERAARAHLTPEELETRLRASRAAAAGVIDNSGIDQLSASWGRAGADAAASQKRIEGVNDALIAQARTAGMSAIEIEVYNRAVEAGVLTDKAAMDAIRGKVNALHALDDVRQITDQIKEQTAATRIEGATIGMTTGAAAAYRAEQEALNRERIKGVKISDELAAKIRGEAKELGNAAQNTAQLRLRDELTFERSQLGRSDIDATVAQRLRGASQPVDLGSDIAGIIRVNEQLRITKDLSLEVAQGFTRDVRGELANGASAWEAFARSGLNALNRLADKLADIALQDLFSKAFGGSGGGGFLSSLLGFGGGNTGGAAVAVGTQHLGGIIGVDRPSGYRRVDPGHFIGAPRFHNGVLPWDPSFELPAILRKDEGVFTKAQMQALGRSADAGGVNVSYAPSYNVTGSGPEIEKLRAEIARDRAEAPQRIVKTIQDARSRRII